MLRNRGVPTVFFRKGESFLGSKEHEKIEEKNGRTLSLQKGPIHANSLTRVSEKGRKGAQRRESGGKVDFKKGGRHLAV